MHSKIFINPGSTFKCLHISVITLISLKSYGLTVDILQEVLPLSKTINAATVRNNVHAVGQRIDKELGEEKVFFKAPPHGLPSSTTMTTNPSDDCMTFRARERINEIQERDDWEQAKERDEESL
jgi:hypothetical protein